MNENLVVSEIIRLTKAGEIPWRYLGYAFFYADFAADYKGNRIMYRYGGLRLRFIAIYDGSKVEVFRADLTKQESKELYAAITSMTIKRGQKQGQVTEANEQREKSTLQKMFPAIFKD
ncbi:MAG: hypothetical protein Q8N88_05055 [Nanoarchaeota archaeon]|nr:hypothetical protein [Nanoarchaeota archaeon]